MKNRDLILMISAIILFMAACGSLIYIIFFSNHENKENSGDADAALEIKESPYKSRLNGVPVDKEEYISPKIIGVMIDNNPDSYPQAGLNRASVIYEAPVEGGITRFLAIYPEYDQVEKVGPVRSARPYYLDWLEEYGTALYMHCGGSAEGLSEIKERKIFDSNEFFRGSYYWRDSAKFAPYNLFTKSESWQKYVADYGANKQFAEWQSWNFSKDYEATGTEKIGAFDVEYIKRFVVGWQYNSASNTYERRLNGEVFADEYGDPIKASDIVVQFATVSVIDEVGRRKVRSIGSGEARIFRDGLMIRGEWKKENLSDRTRFYDRDGKEILFTPGKIWVMIVPEKAVFTVSN